MRETHKGTPARVHHSSKQLEIGSRPASSGLVPRLNLAKTRTIKRPDQSTLLFTIGHSTRTLKEFVALLSAHGVKQLVDVRTIPRSRHNPQFNETRLPRSLERAGIRYRHSPGLGGLRHARRDSTNTAWRNASFRGFADYMQTLEFEEALDELIHRAEKRRTAIMCAEAVPWRCHRSMIADALLVRGLRVKKSRAYSERGHILSLRGPR